MTFKPPHLTKEELIQKLTDLNLLTPQVEKALWYAEKAHKDQKRDFGFPYLEEHIYPIADHIILLHHNDPLIEDILTVGILHDTVEDDASTSFSDIERDFGKELAKNVSLLTKNEEENNSSLSEEQKRRINAEIMKRLESASKIAQIVKLEDRLNNISSFEKADRPKYLRYVEETENIFIPFAEKTISTYKDLLLEQINRLK